MRRCSDRRWVETTPGVIWGEDVIHQGDLFDVLPTFDAESIDACVCDPPYELSFMSKHWDRSGVAFRVETWREVYRVLKPGAYLLAFGGTRTFHRMTCAIEDAGFEIRDCLSWLYGSGFPKSLDVSKAIDAIHITGNSSRKSQRIVNDTRPVVGSKMGRPGTSLGQVRRSGAGFTDDAYLREDGKQPDGGDPAIDRERLGVSIRDGGHRRDLNITTPLTDAAKQWQGWGTALKPSWEPIILARKPFKGTVSANVLQHGTGALNIDACRIGFTDAADKESWKYGGAGKPNLSVDSWKNTSAFIIQNDSGGRWPANVCLDDQAAALLDAQSGELTSNGGGTSSTGFWQRDDRRQPIADGDSGGASRFFYVAKPSREERDYGCEYLPLGPPPASARSNPAPGRENTLGRPRGNHHPTVKPVELMRWLVRLVTPPNGICLDPFTGSGTTGMACRYEQRQFIGIEREEEYVRIAEARIAAVAPLFNDEPEVKRVEPQPLLWADTETDGAA